MDQSVRQSVSTQYVLVYISPLSRGHPFLSFLFCSFLFCSFLFCSFLFCSVLLGHNMA
jgi:hypothetical protein